MTYGHEVAKTEVNDGYDDGLSDFYTCTCGARFEYSDVEEAFEHGQESVANLSTIQRMTYDELSNHAANLDVVPPTPSLAEINAAIDDRGWRGLEYVWDAVEEMIYDEFPQFREPEEGDDDNA